MDYLSLLNTFEKEVVCQYKDETYSVRDNGSVLRHPKANKKIRPTDNYWTFGKYNKKTGYAEIAGEKVHRIVATAFHGPAPSPQHVVDHIDTNRRNNRPDNLRWVTRLENILLNPVTAKKIELLYGSIEEFLKDPSKLRQDHIDKNYEWMRAVSKEEAAASLEKMSEWAKSDPSFSSGSLGEWIYNRNSTKKIKAPEIATDTPENHYLTADTNKTISEPAISLKEKTTKRKRNPFDFPRPTAENNVTMYRTNVELFILLKNKLETEKVIKLPAVVLPTAGKGIVINEACDIDITDVEFYYKGKSRIPEYIILHCENISIALIIQRDYSHNEEIDKLIANGINTFGIDLTWAKDGVTEDEMTYILQTDITLKKWIHHKQIVAATKKLQQICEPLTVADGGVLHSYFACPLISDTVQDIDCWYCNYNILDEESRCNYCFGKSKVQTYKELCSICNVEKEDGKIVSITYNNGDSEATVKFDKEVSLPGKTLLELWDEKDSSKIIAYNIYSGWFVLLDKDPKISLNETGDIYAKLSKNPDKLKNAAARSIFNFDNKCWKTYRNLK